MISMVFHEVSGARTYLFLFSQSLRFFKLLVFIAFSLYTYSANSIACSVWAAFAL